MEGFKATGNYIFKSSKRNPNIVKRNLKVLAIWKTIVDERTFDNAFGSWGKYIAEILGPWT